MKKKLAIMFVTFLVLAGCNAKEDAGPDKTTKEPPATERVESPASDDQIGQNEDELQQEGQSEEMFFDIEETPQTSADLINQPTGPFGGRDLNSDEEKQKIADEIKDMPSLPENATEEDFDKYFRYVYSKVSGDFPNPEDLISKWEFAMSGNPELPDQKYQFKENYHIEVMLDSSGSMANVVGGKTMMELAKEAITNFLSNAPEDANVSLRVYGHKGTGSQEDKEMSCSSIEQLYGYEKYDEANFEEALKTLEPSGWTPIAGAVEQAKEAMGKFDPETTTSLIYIVSDGVETCGGDPVKVAKSLKDAGISPIINIIGFNVDSNAQKQLKEMARISDGTYTTVNNGEELQAEFKRADEVLERWTQWKKDMISDADHQRVEQSFDIMDFYSDWGNTARQQFASLNAFFSIMKDEGIIDIHQKDELRNRAKEVDALVHQAKNEVRDELDQLNLKRAEEIKKQIKEKFESNT